jgi:hypothetical protein
MRIRAKARVGCLVAFATALPGSSQGNRQRENIASAAAQHFN